MEQYCNTTCNTLSNYSNTAYDTISNFHGAQIAIAIFALIALSYLKTTKHVPEEEEEETVVKSVVRCPAVIINNNASKVVSVPPPSDAQTNKNKLVELSRLLLLYSEDKDLSTWSHTTGVGNYVPRLLRLNNILGHNWVEDMDKKEALRRVGRMQLSDEVFRNLKTVINMRYRNLESPKRSRKR